ncbi:putative LPS assembly protein LptD [Dyadobacter psychrophilus]|uniref:LPS assembly outer membrane protein LptD (Organic solvent tolerance protein OstA) n=1 Tax=Dyadobacter psychrophilus TaxID=651661 RepID=A0A1T5GPK7_9BACT|nr:putative LPS assembly protein LptD [Dyadobacter psychrophilus]SKC10311.1 LPS assembly outer membrane protein LptD (organic solvent tolerance protein OstA) [Dyadobacter psychrophilus]
MLELKRKAIIISSVVAAFLIFSTVACVQQRTKRTGKNQGKPNVTTSAKQSADSLVAAKKQAGIDTTGAGKNAASKSGSVTLGDTSLTNKGLTDSTAVDSLSNPDDLQNTVQYTAEDSTIMDAVLKQVHLYGNAEVTYGTINLKASYIRLNWVTNEVYAIGTTDPADSTSKKTVGDPIFQDGPETYNTKEIRYNFKSKKALIQGIVTQEGDGNIRGEKVKKDAEGNFYIRHSIYTTCNLTHPHYFINAPKIKMVNKKQVISGPFNLVISDVPLPIALPFGFFPFPKKKENGTSGILFPTYGEEPNGRGFYLREGGYYFAISEYINASVTGQIYSTGSWGLGVASTYTRRYQYNGNFALRFNKNKSSDEVDRDLGRGQTNDFSIIWSHAPRPRGNSQFSANVNVSSNSYNQLQEFETNKYISNVASSSVQYNRTFGQFMRAAASLRVNQNFGQIDPDPAANGRKKDGKTNISTDFSFGVNQIAPFALKGGRGRWYESFRLGLDFSGNYELTNSLTPIDTNSASLGFSIINNVDPTRQTTKIVPFNLNNLPEMLKDAQFTGRYSLPISLPNFKVLRFVNVTPSLSLQGEVFTKQYAYSVEKNQVRIDTLRQAGTEYSYNFGAGVNTRFYGTFFVKGKRLEAIRHTVIPSLSFTYTPDFTGDAFGFYQKVNIKNRGLDEEYSLSRFRGVGTGVSNGRASSVISFSLNNSFEMKLKTKSDTAAQQFEKVSLLDNLSLGGNYNLLADSLNLSNITVNANARIGKNLNLNFNMNLDPYAYEANPRILSNQVGTKVNKYAITQGQGLANLQNLGFTVGTSFAPKSSDKTKPVTPAANGNPTVTEEQREFIAQNPELYVDFNIPWNVSLNYNFGLTKPGLSKAQLIQAVQVTGDLSLSKNFKVSVNTGFDFTAFEPTITSLTLYRDLHCWDMSFSWTPFAGSASRVSNYNFTLKVKSSILQDLKVTRRRSFYDRSAY